MFHREIIAVCSEIQTKPVNKIYGQNVGFVIIKPDGTYSDHCIAKRVKPFKQYH